MAKRFINWRTSLILVLVCILGAAIISRLFFLQVLERKLFQAQALGQQVGFSSTVGARGQIFCQNSQETKGSRGSGKIKSLAINKNNWAIIATAEDIPDKALFAEALSKNINLTKEQILSKLESQDTYIVLEKDLSSEKLDKIKELNLKGLSWQNEPKRFYPQGNLAPQTLGFLGGEGLGQYGIEGYYEEILKGKSGVIEKKGGLNAIFFDDNKISLDGSDLYLTLDYNIQFQAESLLKQAKENLKIESGQIIVLKPDSGRILALANYPSFNINQYNKEKKIEIFQNSAVQKLFEPGSIMKPFTMAIGLNEGKIAPDTTFVDPGTVTFGPDTIHNFDNKKYGEETMTQVLEKSINTGAVFVSQLIPHKMYLEYIDRFGFTQKTDVDLQGETYSRNDKFKTASDIDFATASFGQGIELTPIQIAAGFCAIANGGKLVKPYIVEKIINNKDQTEIKPEISGQIISQQTASQLTTMLISVVEQGYGNGAKIPGYYLAGKTGTAQVPLKNGRGYEPDKTIQSFIGYGPAFSPQFLILVKLDDPKVSKSSLSAVPIFKELTQYIINYWKIPPDYDPLKK